MTAGLRADYVSYAVDEKVLVSEVKLELNPGDLLAVVGPNGAGKSTLCGLLAGDIAPMAGSIQVCGHGLQRTKPAVLARLRAMLTQQTQIRFPFTAREVVMMGRHPHIRQWRSPKEADFSAVEDAMRAVQVTHLADRIYPTLSGGEQRRVSLARVLAQDTPVLLLDEPTDALDISHQQLVMSLCRRLADQQRAVLAVLHDLNLAAAYADRIVVLSEGQVVALGKPEEVLTPELLYEVFKQRVIVIPHPQTNKPVVLASSNGAGMLTPSSVKQRVNGNQN